MKSILFSLLLIIVSSSYSQQISTIHLGNNDDSSYYHLTKIDANEFWAGGEYGIISIFDTLGNMRSLSLPLNGAAVLKIEKKDEYIFILTDDASIIKYNHNNGSYVKSNFSAFKKKCFYDMLFTKDNQILLCGGTSGISKAQRKIPFGFIAVTNINLDNPTIVWKSFRKFVWSLKERADHRILAATFNGLNSKILISSNGFKWKKYMSVKGLVHEINTINNKTTYCGTGGIHFNKKGFYQIEGEQKQLFKQEGCFWSMEEYENSPIIVTQKGKYILYSLNSKPKLFQLPTDFPIYDLETISNGKFMMVGHGKSAFIVDTKL